MFQSDSVYFCEYVMLNLHKQNLWFSGLNEADERHGVAVDR